MSRPKQPAKGKRNKPAMRIAEAHSKAFPNGTPKTEAEPTDAAQALADAHNLVSLAERTFEAQGEFAEGHEVILREALRTACDDFDVIGLALVSGTGVSSSVFTRAMARCDLALAISQFRERYGYIRDPNGFRVRPLRVDEQRTTEVQS